MLTNILLQGIPVVLEGHEVVLFGHSSVGPEDDPLTDVDGNVKLVMHDEALRGKSNLKIELRRCGRGQLQGHQRAEEIISMEARELASRGDD